MKTFIISSLFSITAAGIAFAQADESPMKELTVDGVKISYKVKLFEPPTVVTMNEKMLNQSSAVNCSYLLYSKLAKGDINEAAALSNNAAAVKQDYTLYRERIGDEKFKKMFSNYFGGGLSLRYELTIGTRHMLVIHDKEMDMPTAQFYVDDGKKFIVDEKESKEKDQLGKLFNALQDGTLNMK